MDKTKQSESASQPAQPAQYAVVFVSRQTEDEADQYAQTAERMEALARQQPGFVGVDSVRGADALGITVSYWESLESIRNWGKQLEHLQAQAAGRNRWYKSYDIYVTRIEEHRLFAAVERSA